MPPLLLGLAVGLASAVPLGPQNAYLLRAGLVPSLRRAVAVTALVVALDVSVSLTGLAVAGSALVSAPALRVPALLLGAVVLLVCGARLLREVPGARHRRGTGVDRHPVAGALAVTWLNPAALADSALLFGGLVAGTAGADLPALVVGLCSGSVLWAAALLTGLRACRARLADRGRRRLERAAGAVVVLVGLRLAGQAAGVL